LSLQLGPDGRGNGIPLQFHVHSRLMVEGNRDCPPTVNYDCHNLTIVVNFVVVFSLHFGIRRSSKHSWEARVEESLQLDELVRERAPSCIFKTPSWRHQADDQLESPLEDLIHEESSLASRQPWHRNREPDITTRKTPFTAKQNFVVSEDYITSPVILQSFYISTFKIPPGSPAN
jgi:hypothetical protein